MAISKKMLLSPVKNSIFWERKIGAKISRPLPFLHFSLHSTTPSYSALPNTPGVALIAKNQRRQAKASLPEKKRNGRAHYMSGATNIQ
jgi:hypothetical protein